MDDTYTTAYNPKHTEEKWYRFWEENNLFTAKPDPSKKPFCIVIPPPNVTGILHMGHALNNTIQDILIRYHRMKGDETLWMPGTDHAGIATQNVVEKAIAKEGLKRQDLGREKFIERVWQWKQQYGSTIINQLKRLGASCDWRHSRFTMDEGYSQAVTEVFVRLYKKGVIYQDNYIVNWCPRCQTALSDEEAPHKEIEGNLYYIRYPLLIDQRSSVISQGAKRNKHQIANDYIVVATTRPETMLGDTAVAVNPKDKRYNKLIGATVILPLIKREIRIIADSIVDMEFGTGAVKVTPAHDPNDYLLGKKHKLEFVNIMYPDGRLNENADVFKGMDRFEARQAVVEALTKEGLLEKIEPHILSAGHCYRCDTLVEPYLSKQWFVKMKPLARPAIRVVKQAKIRFYPKKWTRIYLNWMENIRDWCISRQIWWGHRLPVYYCRRCYKEELVTTRGSDTTKGVIVSSVRPQRCPECGYEDIYQDEDVLDTWFSSWLWPFATFGWPFKIEDDKERSKKEAELRYFYPTSVLVTASEIIFFWVARMIMAGIEFMKDIPFKDVYIHGTVRDIEGKKMSKSLGNIIDPLEIINEYGADALRFSLISLTATGQDIFLSKDKFHQGRNFANKIWNAARFVIMNLDMSKTNTDLCVFFEKEQLSIFNRWILSRFYSTLKKVNAALDNYRFNDVANLLYGFLWHDFCDWYLEIIKYDIRNPHNQLVMYKILEEFLRALHPVMPFITEDIWQRIHKDNIHNGSIMVQSWPHIHEEMIDRKTERMTEIIFEVIRKIRNMRVEIEIKPEQTIEVSIYPHKATVKRLIKENSGIIIALGRLNRLNILDSYKRPQSTISDITGQTDIFLHFGGIIDVAKEKKKIEEKLISERNRYDSKNKLLKKVDFIKKAPKEVVEGIRQAVQESKDKIEHLERVYNELL
ncbi:MAG: valine--tRNA ligase [Candidatus Omnitrophica bacterium]|nr:valine--tRNA ligase [Candidatus Omnitrophota bacterium]